MISGKELVKLAHKSPIELDRCNILARFIARNEPEVVRKLEARGYSQVSIDKLRACISYPTGVGHREYMEKLLKHI